MNISIFGNRYILSREAIPIANTPQVIPAITLTERTSSDHLKLQMITLSELDVTLPANGREAADAP